MRNSCNSVCHFVESSPFFFPGQQFIVYLPSLTLGPAALPKNTFCQPNFLNLPSRCLFLTSFCQQRRSSSCFLFCFLSLSAMPAFHEGLSQQPALSCSCFFCSCFCQVVGSGVDRVIRLGGEGSHFCHCCCQPSEDANDEADNVGILSTFSSSDDIIRQSKMLQTRLLLALKVESCSR